MFEPVHGSAPDIAGKGIANPIAQIWSGAMMLEFLGHQDAADDLIEAIESALLQPEVLTPDMGGEGTTQSLADRIRSNCV
jgi:tartrate dehydrogenase/decarboxylase/D-malate dehydrogenase